MNNLILPNLLSEVLLKNWATFINKKIIIQRVLKDAVQANLKQLEQHTLNNQTQITITKFDLKDNINFELWIEFGLSVDNRYLIGTHIYSLRLDGTLTLECTNGVSLLKNV